MNLDYNMRHFSPSPLDEILLPLHTGAQLFSEVHASAKHEFYFVHEGEVSVNF